MSYTCRQAVVAFIEACGPASIGTLRRECRKQANDYSALVFLGALVDLQREGIIHSADDMTGIVFEILS